MDVLKNFLFPKIDFKRDIICTKIWFPYGKRLLANNIKKETLDYVNSGAVNGSLNKCIRRYFFPLSSQRHKEAKKKTSDLRLCHDILKEQCPRGLLTENEHFGANCLWDVSRLYSENSIQTLLIFFWVDPKKFRRVCMEFSKHNWATISETICPEMLIFGE